MFQLFRGLELLEIEINRLRNIETNLERVIKALEWMQNNHYDSFRSLTLSYLYDIKNNSVPNNLVTDKKKPKDDKTK